MPSTHNWQRTFEIWKNIFYFTMVFSQFVYKMYKFSLTKKKTKTKKIFYALHFKCSYLYTKHTKKKYIKLKMNSCLNGESSESLRREESRSPLALPELRLYLTLLLPACHAQWSDSPHTDTVSPVLYLRKHTQTKQKVINFMSYKYNLGYLSVIRAYSLFSYDVFLYWTLRDFRPSE